MSWGVVGLRARRISNLFLIEPCASAEDDDMRWDSPWHHPRLTKTQDLCDVVHIPAFVRARTVSHFLMPGGCMAGVFSFRITAVLLVEKLPCCRAGSAEYGPSPRPTGRFFICVSRCGDETVGQEVR